MRTREPLPNILFRLVVDLFNKSIILILRSLVDNPHRNKLAS